MTQKQAFEPLDAMDVRTQLGEILDRVSLTNQRFQIMRRGRVKALLVPVSDQKSIETEVAEDTLSQTYQALKTIKGIVKNPELKDASSTIDVYLYNNPNDTEGHE